MIAAIYARKSTDQNVPDEGGSTWPDAVDGINQVKAHRRA